MNKLASTGWPTGKPSFRPSQPGSPQKTMGHSRKARTGHVEVSKQLRSLALIVLASLTLATSASAQENEHAYPGMMCQPVNSTDRVGRTGQAMENNGTGGQIWICPVVKDVRNDSDPEFARISVSQQAVEIDCDFRSRNAEGKQLKTALPDERKVSEDGSVHHIGFGVGNSNIKVGVTAGYYFFRCEVPSGGKVFSYVVTEEGGGP